MPRQIRFTIPLLVLAALLAVACSGTVSPSPSAARTKLVVGLGYIPSVQFAQFYLADQAGYYRDAGLDVTFQNGNDADIIPLVGQGKLDIGIADGTSVIPARSQSIPIRYVATIYGTFPNIVFTKASSGITKIADLKGRKLGTPGKYGSSWIMLQAMLQSVGLTTSDVNVVEYGDYTQGVALQQGAVDAATGFINNEPIQLKRSGSEPVVFHVDDIVALPGNGLIAGESTLASKKPALAAFVAATLRAMDEIAAAPDKGLTAALTAVPDLASTRDLQAEILNATIQTWKPKGGAAFGTIDQAGWQASIDFMGKLPDNPVPNAVTVDALVTSELLPKR